jgi:anti-sigma B factor antagonist
VNEFQIKRLKEGDQTTLVVEGELDVFTSSRLREELVELEGSGERRIGLDLSLISYLDSTAMSVIVQSHKRLTNDNGELWIVGASRQVRRVFEIIGLKNMLKEAPTA